MRLQHPCIRPKLSTKPNLSPGGELSKLPPVRPGGCLPSPFFLSPPFAFPFPPFVPFNTSESKWRKRSATTGVRDRYGSASPPVQQAISDLTFGLSAF